MIRWLRNGPGKLARTKVGRRGASLMFWGFLAFSSGMVSFSTQPEQREIDNIHFLAAYVPLWVLSTAWTVAGILCFVAAFWKRLEEPAFAVMSFMATVYGCATLVSTLFGYGEQLLWVNVLLYFAIAINIQIIAGWPEPSHTPEGPTDEDTS